MELRRQSLEVHVVGANCDICKKSCQTNPQYSCEYSHEYATLSANWGYWSKDKDLTRDECHICETCFAKVKAFIESLGGCVRTMRYSEFKPTTPHLKDRPGIDYTMLS